MDNIIELKQGTVCVQFKGTFYANNCKFPIGATGITIIGQDNECVVSKSTVIGRNNVIGDHNRLRDAHNSTVTGNYNSVEGLKVDILSGFKNKVRGSVEKDYGNSTEITEARPTADINGCDYVTKVACTSFDLPVETAEAMTDNQILSYIAMKTGLPLDFFGHLAVEPSKKRKREPERGAKTTKPLPSIPTSADDESVPLCGVCKGFGRSCVIVHEDTDGDSTGCFLLCASCATDNDFHTCPHCRKPSKKVIRLTNMAKDQK